MAIESYFFNSVNSDRVYNSEDFCSYLQQIIGNGVFPNPSTSLQVRASTGMTVIVGAGQGWINGHKMVSNADYNLTVATASASNPRIDTVVFYLDLSNRTMGLRIKSGTAAANPTAPALTRSASVYELGLANIYVSKGVTAITASVISDTRMDSNRCGIVQGLIQQVSTTTLWQQQQAEFEEWLDSINDQYVETGGAPVPEVKELLYKNNQVASASGSSTIATFTLPKGICFIKLLGTYTESAETSGKGSRTLSLAKAGSTTQDWLRKFIDYKLAMPTTNYSATSTYLHVFGIIYSTNEETYYIKAGQNSGITLNLDVYGEVIRFSPIYNMMQ